jgi:hypothetical protein
MLPTSRTPPRRSSGPLRFDEHQRADRQTPHPPAVVDPGGAIALLLAPMILTKRSFGPDWTNHLWLIWNQGRSIADGGNPSYFVHTDNLGGFDLYFASPRRRRRPAAARPRRVSRRLRAHRGGQRATPGPAAGPTARRSCHGNPPGRRRRAADQHRRGPLPAGSHRRPSTGSRRRWPPGRAAGAIGRPSDDGGHRTLVPIRVGVWASICWRLRLRASASLLCCAARGGDRDGDPARSPARTVAPLLAAIIRARPSPPGPW